jgi:outer membrane protein W
MKKALTFILLMTLASGLSFGQTKRFQVSLFGGLDHILAYGSVDEYAAGSNDFPVTPAHTPANFGAAFTYFLSDRLGIELRGEYTLASSMTLSDPSDQDTVSVNSSKHYAGSLNVLWEFVGQTIRPYLVLGGGADKVSSDLVMAVSEYGYEVTFTPPNKTLSFFANAGGGVRYLASSSLGVQLDLRYRVLFVDTNKINGLIAAAGVFLRF